MDFGGFNANGLHRLIRLNFWSLVSEIVWGRIRKCGLVGEGVPLEISFEVSKAHSKPSFTLFAGCLWIKM